VVPDASILLCLEQVPSGGLEELECGGVLEGRRVGQVNDDLRVDERRIQALTGDCVDTGVR
jgi:hypothetical protein